MQRLRCWYIPACRGRRRPAACGPVPRRPAYTASWLMRPDVSHIGLAVDTGDGGSCRRPPLGGRTRLVDSKIIFCINVRMAFHCSFTSIHLRSVHYFGPPTERSPLLFAVPSAISPYLYSCCWRLIMLLSACLHTSAEISLLSPRYATNDIVGNCRSVVPS